jgi:hypothetical protein
VANFEMIKAELDGAGVAVRILHERLSWLQLLQLFAGVAIANAKGEPWDNLPAPEDEKETLSREQLGSSVLLYRGLHQFMDGEEALALTGRVIHDASVSFLQVNVPILSKRKLLNLPKKVQAAYARRIAEKFFNADAEMTFDGQKSVAMTVRRCRFPELLGKVGTPELAPLFCEGDKAFFANHQPEVTLKRTQTLATGGTECDFSFHWKD